MADGCEKLGLKLVEFHLAGDLRLQANWLWDVVSAVGWALLLVLLVGGGALVEWVSPWLILLLYVAAFRGLAINRFVTNVWIATIGGMCYSIYLLHNYLVAALGMLTERVLAAGPFTLRLLVQFALITPFVLALSAIFFRWVERPCMRPDWPRRLKAALARLRTRWFLTPAVAGSSRSSFDE